MFEIQKVKVGTVAKVFAVIAVLLHLIAGLLITVSYAAARTFLAHSFLTSGFGAVTLLLVWLSATVGILIVSYIAGLIVGACYNLCAAWWGGFVVQLNTVAVAKVKKEKVQKASRLDEEDADDESDADDEAEDEQEVEDAKVEEEENENTETAEEEQQAPQEKKSGKKVKSSAKH